MENARSNGPPWQSRLIPYEEEILELRRRRPLMPFEQITARLATKHGGKVHLDRIVNKHNYAGSYAQSAQSNSAWANTVFVASSCKSGG